MDQSDRIRKADAKPVWVDYSTQKLATQAGCVYGTCGQSLNKTCKVRYTSYAEKYKVVLGRQVCSCSTSGTCTE